MTGGRIIKHKNTKAQSPPRRDRENKKAKAAEICLEI